jgi:fatty acid desaturase
MASATSVEAAGTRARQREGLRPAERVEAWPCYSSPAQSFYAEATGALRRDLAGAVPRDVLRALHRCQAWRHFAVVGAQLAVLAAGVALAAGGGWVWPLGSALIGLVIFNFTVLLHEVVHQNVFRRRRHWANRVLGLLYAAPCGLVPSQFARWHLDHHAQLGDPAADPKRCHLSPKRNARWLKALYWTPALFPIYFRAARRAAAAYPPALRRVIARERAAMMVGHAALLAGLVVAGGWMLALKVYLIPLFFVFPIAFALNRLAQH